MSFTSRKCFLEIPEIIKYTNHLSDLVTARAEFKHTYKIEHKTWKKTYGPAWSCDDLIDAKEKYWWHGSFNDNKEQLAKLSKGLRKAVISGTDCEALYWSLRVLEWGDVYKGCTGYILDNYEKQTLRCKITDATKILDGNEYDVTRFNDSDLRMDSGLTKIYSLNSEQSIIFDSRVSAALVLIAWRLFSNDEIKIVTKLNIFAGGKATGNTVNRVKRSHVNGVKVFNQLLGPTNQARLNLLANWIIAEAITIAELKQPNIYELWKENTRVGLLRAVEASLFMVGSDISNG